MSTKQCFIVSPIGESGSEIRRRADQVLKHLIIPSVVECGFTSDNVVRADTISNPGAITHQIISAIINADLVVADLTGNNANVFYELAIRHVLRKPYVQICDINTPLPFDVKNQRTIMFDYKDLDSVADAKVLLIQYAKNALAHPDSLMTPIHEGLIIEGLLTSDKPNEQLLGQLMENVSELTDQVKRMSFDLSSGNSERNLSNRLDALSIAEFNEYKHNNDKKAAIRRQMQLGTLKPGDIVKHAKFGIGEVTQIKGEGLDSEVHISFPEPVGTKRLLPGFAPIEML
ncbi:hypothetical protein [Paenibacillus phytohabitans]|uniref:hypothetical protein n=1 Tax=Paenibacillus phytohabitans TaxID=2654978 RepID=UPI00300A064E